MARQDTQSSKATHKRLLQLQSTSAELMVGVLAILLLTATVARLAFTLQAGDAPSMLLTSASISAVIALIFYWLWLRKSRATVARDLTYLEKSETRLTGIIRSSMEAIISVDETQCIVLFNPVAETLFGCSARQTTDYPLSDLIPERFHGAHGAHVRRFGVTGVSERQMGKRHPLSALRTNGCEFPTGALISQIRMNGGKLFMVMLRNTTERVCAETVLRCSREELQHLSDSILATHEEERHCITHELHDDLGQRLSVLKVDISLLTADLQATRSDKALIDQTQAMRRVTDETIVTVRQISADLRPPLLNKLGLVPSLEWMAKSFHQHFDLIVTVHTQGLAMSERATISVFRVIWEALNNIVRHADATRVEIEFSQQDDALELSVQDNGHGWSGTPPTVGEHKPLGLLGIREHARLLGGQAMIIHAPGGGFRLSVNFPAAHKATEEVPS